MRRPRVNGTGGTDDPGRPARSEIEDVLIRNHDFQWGYDLDLRVREIDDGTAFEKHYYLQPGGTRSEFDVLDPGEYVVEVVLDNDRALTRTCRLGCAASGGVLVELGNGAVSVHDGLYG